MKDVLIFCEELISGTLPLMLILLGGLYITLKCGFFQFARFSESAKLVKKAFKNSKLQKGKGVTSFQSACTALSATVGTGNIAGVAGAVSIGGAGAIFWMWISALVGMAIKFAEISLAITYRENKNGNFLGGPMYYIKKGLPSKLKILSPLFALAAIPSVFCSGNITQTNAAVLSIGGDFKLRFILGIIFAVFTVAVTFGGSRRIAYVTEKIIPVISVVYVIMTLGVILLNIDFLPEAVKMIFKGAFTPKSVTGGAVGSIFTAVVTGTARGVFSNEAGLGTSAMAHSVAVDADSKTQGLFGIFEVFVDTILICTLTALTILCSRVEVNYGKMASSELVNKALFGIYGKSAVWLLGIMMCLFAFSSVVGWAMYGNICTEFLFGKRGRLIFSAVYPLGCIAGAVFNAEIAWRLCAFFNGIMLCINLPSILLLIDSFTKYTKKRKPKND